MDSCYFLSVVCISVQAKLNPFTEVVQSLKRAQASRPHSPSRPDKGWGQGFATRIPHQAFAIIKRASHTFTLAVLS